jgi:hypothetical protein
MISVTFGIFGFLLLLGIVCYSVFAIIAFLEIKDEYETPPGDRKIMESLLINIPRGVSHKSWYVNSIYLQIGDMPLIKKTGWWMYLAPYYIVGVGIVPTWYKSYRIIKKIFKEETKK